jgi:hypothetical protein
MDRCNILTAIALPPNFRETLKNIGVNDRGDWEEFVFLGVFEVGRRK